MPSARAQAVDPALEALIKGPQRSPANSVRDKYRHPAELLTFFGVRPDSTVVEILPGSGGYWTEILAPYQKAHGRYIAANGEKASTSEETRKDNAALAAKLAADPADYGKVVGFGHGVLVARQRGRGKTVAPCPAILVRTKYRS